MKLAQYVNGKTQIYGLLGHPIEHTLSPVIHNSIARLVGHDLIYVPFHVYPEHLQQAIQGAYGLHIQGMNVTVPHKQAVIPFLKGIDPMAQKIGAVNTLKRTTDGYVGYNTDAAGLRRSMIQKGIPLKGQTVLILGAGGAARAAAMMAADQKPKQIWISNRTIEKAELLAVDVQKFYSIPVQAVSFNNIYDLLHIDICIQTTPIGMSPNEIKTPISDLSFFKKLDAAVDLIYNPSETIFLKNAKQANCITLNGFGMLFYQAVQAYEIWNELTIPEEEQKKLIEIIQKEYID